VDLRTLARLTMAVRNDQPSQLSSLIRGLLVEIWPAYDYFAPRMERHQGLCAAKQRCRDSSAVAGNSSCFRELDTRSKKSPRCVGSYSYSHLTQSRLVLRTDDNDEWWCETRYHQTPVAPYYEWYTCTCMTASVHVICRSTPSYPSDVVLYKKISALLFEQHYLPPELNALHMALLVWSRPLKSSHTTQLNLTLTAPSRAKWHQPNALPSGSPNDIEAASTPEPSAPNPGAPVRISSFFGANAPPAAAACCSMASSPASPQAMRRPIEQRETN
jgi:hypothetical protein